MFRFIIRGRKCAKYVDACLSSLTAQTVRDWCALVIVDPSDDCTVEQVRKWIRIDSRIAMIENLERRGVCRNMWLGLQEIGKPCSCAPAATNNDIVCILDLDDFLCSDKSLEIVSRFYFDHSHLMATYGSFVLKNGEPSKLCRPYDKREVPRYSKWRASHMKTFKYSVVKHIPKEYFMHNGVWGEGASDLALMFCVMELVGLKRVGFLNKNVYCYRNDIPNSLNRDTQIIWKKRWKKKKPLKTIF